MDTDESARNQIDEREMQQLLSYIRDGDTDKVKMMVPSIRDINMITKNGRPSITPLCLACERENSDIVDLLLEAGADPNLYASEAPLATASGHQTGNLQMVKNLLARGAYVNGSNDIGTTALHAACGTNNLDVVRCLVETGADVNANINAMIGDYLPVKGVAETGNVDILDFMVQSGADMKADGLLSLFLNVALERDHGVKMLDYLIQLGTQPGIHELLLVIAIYSRKRKDDFSLIESLLNSGIDINGELPPEFDEDITPMHVACASEEIGVELLKMLIDRGADVNKKSPITGATLLRAAAESLDCEKILFLLWRKIDVNALSDLCSVWGTIIETATDAALRKLVLFSSANFADSKRAEEAIAAVILFFSAGGHVTREMFEIVNDEVNANARIIPELRQRILQCLESFKQPRRLTHLCCIKVRDLLPSPIEEKAFHLSGLLPGQVLKGVVDYSLT